MMSWLDVDFTERRFRADCDEQTLCLMCGALQFCGLALGNNHCDDDGSSGGGGGRQALDTQLSRRLLVGEHGQIRQRLQRSGEEVPGQHLQRWLGRKERDPLDGDGKQVWLLPAVAMTLRAHRRKESLSNDSPCC